MKDTEIRELVLKHLYEHRNEPDYEIEGSHLSPPLSDSVLIRICEQLQRQRLIEANIIPYLGGEKAMLECRISAEGVDFIESGSSSRHGREQMPPQQINISGSTNVVIGNNNQQTVHDSVEALVKLIEASKGTAEEKAAAKGLLARFLEHPLVTAVAGGSISTIAAML